MKLLKQNFAYLSGMIREEFLPRLRPNYSTEIETVRQDKSLILFVIIKPQTDYDAAVIAGIVRKYNIPTIKKGV